MCSCHLMPFSHNPALLSAIAATMSAFCAAIGMIATIWGIQLQTRRDKQQIRVKVYPIHDNPLDEKSPVLLCVHIANIGLITVSISRLCFYVKVGKGIFTKRIPCPILPVQRGKNRSQFFSKDDFPVEVEPFRSAFFAIPKNQLEKINVRKRDQLCIILGDGYKVKSKMGGKMFKSFFQHS